MKKIITTILIVFNSLIVFGQSNDCGCYDGIGSSRNDAPVLITKFDNGQILSVCGYLERRLSNWEIIISEFNIFSCNTGESLVEYGASDNCNVKFENSVLTIDKMSFLPAGDNWTWQYVTIASQQISKKGNGLIITALSPNYKTREIPSTRINSFLNEIEKLKGKGYNDAFEEIIGKLEIIALNNNTQAYNILVDFNNYFGFITVGAIAEQLDDAISTINFVKRRNMH